MSESGEEVVAVIASTDSARQIQAITQPDQRARRPIASHDGRLIAFQSNRESGIEVWVINADGSGERQLTRTGGAVMPLFTADDRWLLFGGIGKGGIWKVPVAGGEPSRLFIAGPRALPTSAFPQALSPDGRLLCFRYDGQSDSTPLYGVISMDGSQPWRPLKGVNAIVDLIAFTADAHSVTYVETREGIDNVWQLALDDATPMQLTRFTSGRILGLGWSRDGKRLALSRGTSTSDVVLITDDTSPGARR